MGAEDVRGLVRKLKRPLQVNRHGRPHPGAACGRYVSNMAPSQHSNAWGTR